MRVVGVISSQPFWHLRPFKLLTRFVEAGIKVGGFLLSRKLDEWTGTEDQMRPQRAVEARELITDLGVTFIKIAQVWASRPDILPKESCGRDLCTFCLS